MICCFKHKTAYEMLIRYWISDVCSSDLSGVDCDPVFSGCFAMSAARETLLSALDAYVHPLIGRGLVAAGTIASAEIVGDAAQVVIELGFPSASKIGRANVCTPVTNAHLVCRLLLEQNMT